MRLNVGETLRLTGLPARKGSDLSVHSARATRECVMTQTASPLSGVQGSTESIVVDDDASFREALRQTQATIEACPRNPVHAVGGRSSRQACGRGETWTQLRRSAALRLRQRPISSGTVR